MPKVCLKRDGEIVFSINKVFPVMLDVVLCTGASDADVFWETLVQSRSGLSFDELRLCYLEHTA